MEVQVISETVQKFNGESFYLCGNYFQRKGKRLHRTVWAFHNGEIPEGYDIHHKDEDKAHNDIENLELLKREDHHRHHMSTEERKEQSRKDVKKAIAAAPAWHRSKEGYEWHSKLGKENYENRKVNTYKCTYCGKEFQTKHVYHEGANHFCHNNCKCAYRRMRVRNGEIPK